MTIISIFNKNVYRTTCDWERTDLTTPQSANKTAVDRGIRSTEAIFDQKAGQEMLSGIRGQHEILANNRMKVTKFDGSRVQIVGAQGQLI